MRHSATVTIADRLDDLIGNLCHGSERGLLFENNTNVFVMTVTVTGEGISPLIPQAANRQLPLLVLTAVWSIASFFKEAPLSLRLMMPLTIFQLRRPSLFTDVANQAHRKPSTSLSPRFNLFNIVLIYATLRYSHVSGARYICISVRR